METIIGSLITGVLTLIGVIYTCNRNNDKNMKAIEARLDKAQAVTDCKLEELTREVREHNGFARRMPALEERVDRIDEKIGIYHSHK